MNNDYFAFVPDGVHILTNYFSRCNQQREYSVRI
jgi:hypothetical protein